MKFENKKKPKEQSETSPGNYSTLSEEQFEKLDIPGLKEPEFSELKYPEIRVIDGCNIKEADINSDGKVDISHASYIAPFFRENKSAAKCENLFTADGKYSIALERIVENSTDVRVVVMSRGYNMKYSELNSKLKQQKEDILNADGLNNEKFELLNRLTKERITADNIRTHSKDIIEFFRHFGSSAELDTVGFHDAVSKLAQLDPPIPVIVAAGNIEWWAYGSRDIFNTVTLSDVIAVGGLQPVVDNTNQAQISEGEFSPVSFSGSVIGPGPKSVSLDSRDYVLWKGSVVNSLVDTYRPAKADNNIKLKDESGIMSIFGMHSYEIDIDGDGKVDETLDSFVDERLEKGEKEITFEPADGTSIAAPQAVEEVMDFIDMGYSIKEIKSILRSNTEASGVEGQSVNQLLGINSKP